MFHLSHSLSRPFLFCLLAALLLAPISGVALAQSGAPHSPDAVQAVVAGDAAVEPSAAIDQAIPSLQSSLAQMAAAHRAGNREKLATFAGERHFDLASDSVRVILEMAHSPEAHPVGKGSAEIVALPNGQRATVEHTPTIAVRPALADAIAATGATYETAYRNWVQVSAPLDSLEALAQIPGVRYVRLPLPAKQQNLPARNGAGPDAPQVGTQTSEGVALTNADVWQASPNNYDGTGVNLAVFDFGFTGWATRQTNGDLPSGANLVLKDFSVDYSFSPDTSGYAHGTACAEIAYDMAPGAKVYLYAWSTDVEFANAVSDYNTNVSGKKVASMSIGWVNAGPYDGTGPVNDIVNTSATTYNVLWSVSAGNDQKSHWSGTSARYGATDYVQFGTDQYNEFGTSETSYWVITSAYGTVTAFLEWPDWNAARNGNQSGVDYDLRLWRKRGAAGWTNVASSTNRQCGNAAVTPTEDISYNIPATCTSSNQCIFRLSIERFTGCTNNFDHWLNLFTWTGFWQSGTGDVTSFAVANTCNSITTPADADGALGVGASFWGDDANSSLTYGLESFSSFGPRSASGGTDPGTTVSKPDVVAPDGVSTAAYGASNGQNWTVLTSTGFFGTSGAAPHVAGAAADVWTANPSYTLAQVRNYIQGQALAKADGGTCGGAPAAVAASPQSATQNNRFGWGRLNLTLSPTAVTLARFRGQGLPQAMPFAGVTAMLIFGAAVLIRRRRR